MFLDSDNDPVAARSDAMRAMMAYEVHGIDDFMLSFQLIAFKLAAAKASVAALNGRLTQAERAKFRAHAAEFSRRARQTATFLDADRTSLETRMDANTSPVTKAGLDPVRR